ncbi:MULTISPECIES: UPF0058 family protein [unclassified Archaeoglobus]|jgi:hypothetical protein|uniref:UPF0058 family protein n=1 Tax=unclassified Archaeoglobus TaxID=2643606 RepID=UPI0025BB0855|nr:MULTISPECIES: UPF0058 family protein [unclassified Archaeoglobus]
MHKEEIVLLHMTLFHIKRLFENAGIANGHFRSYDELGVQPVHIHRSKSDHKKAILLLCKGISEVFRERSPDDLIENENLRMLIESIVPELCEP